MNSLRLLTLLTSVSCVMGACQARTDQGSAESSGDSDVRLYVLDCGRISVADVSLFSGQDQGERKDLTVSCYLIDHPDGKLLYDTGLPESFADSLEGVDFGPFHLSVPKRLSEQLAGIGVAAEEVTHLAISHLHFDHAGNANDYASATWLVQQPEFDAAFDSAAAAENGFSIELYDSLRSSRKNVLDGDFDVFGDGRVLVLFTPGHTMGHQALFVDLAEHGPVVLSGDLWHFTEQRAAKRVPVFNYDSLMTKASMDRVDSLIARTGATLWIGHDLEQNAGIPHAPEYLE